MNLPPSVGRLPELNMQPMTGPIMPRVEQGAPDDTYKTEAIRGIHAPTELNQRYFSRKNIDLLHSRLIDGVFRETGKTIAKQDENELKPIMRSIYLTYARHRLGDEDNEIDELNQRVLDYAIPNVVSTMNHYYNTYYKDLTTMPTPLALPQQARMAGTKGVYSPNSVKFF